MAPLDITKLKLYYISFNKLPSLETELRSLGFVDVNLFEAIDGRKLDPFQLKEDGVISIRSFNELFTGVAVNNITFFGCSPQSSFITASARNVFALRKL